MEHILYWAAPAWEVLLAIAIGGLVLARLLGLTLARPRVPDALAALDPGLADAPLFFFEPVRGVQPLSAAAVELLGQGKLDEDEERLLIATLLEAFERGQAALYPAWPKPGSALQVIALGTKGRRSQGVLAVVVREVAVGDEVGDIDSVVAQPTKIDTHSREALIDLQWQNLGSRLRLHRQRPLVEVRHRRSGHEGYDGPEEPEMHWRASQLSYTEEALLRQLVSHPGEVQDPSLLFKTAWPSEPVSRNGLHADQRDRLRRLVFQLRQRIEPEPASPRYVCTAHGVGYVFYLSDEPE